MEKSIVLKEYERWLRSGSISEFDKEELRMLGENEIIERFSSTLGFGTAGVRRKMEIGPGGLNIYTVRHITRSLAKYMGNGSVVIAYDSRNNSELFARESARVLAGKGINVFLFDGIRPTPELSFAVRELSADAGINITASHNTREYNGYKLYGADGAQIGPSTAEEIAALMAQDDILESHDLIEYDEAVKEGLVKIIGDAIDESYIQNVLGQSRISPESLEVAKNIKIVYTAFHGTGYRFVPQVLYLDGFHNVVCEASQLIPDGDFPTVSSPNPEYKESFKLATDLAEREGAKLVIGTDPDGDRCGVAISVDGDFKVLTGNQVGVLLLDYIIKSYVASKGIPNNAYAVKSIVSTQMANRICEAHGIEMVETLTGFKFIGEEMERLSVDQGREYILGFEESNGYLTGLYSRDKDAVLAAMLVAEMAAYHESNGKDLSQALEELYAEYGYYSEKVVSKEYVGHTGQEQMNALMDFFRANAMDAVAGEQVVRVVDYLGDNTGLPKSDVVLFELKNGSSIVIRPSGTEPKVKIYLSARSDKKEGSEQKLFMLENAINEILERIAVQ